MIFSGKRMVLLFLLLISVPALPMDGQSGTFFSREGQRKILISPLFAGVTLGLALLTLYEKPETINNVAGDETVQFVRDTLKDAGYSDEQIKTVRILSGTQSQTTRRTISVSFNDEQLLRARRYYVTRDDQEGKDIARAYMRKLREQKRLDVLGDEELYAILHLVGKIVTRDSLPLWRGQIVHEMGHIVHKHVAKRMWFSALCSPIIAYPVSAIMQTQYKQGVIPVAAMAFILFYTMTAPLWRPQEKQADEEVVKRVQDPEQLAIVGRLFELMSSQSKIKDLMVKMAYFFDSHPSYAERAGMFMEARDQILQMQEAA